MNNLLFDVRIFSKKKKNMSIETFTWRNCLFLNKKVKYMKGGKSIWVSQRTLFKNSSLKRKRKRKRRKELTDAAVSPFKARRTCAGIVIHIIYAYSIV